MAPIPFPTSPSRWALPLASPWRRCRCGPAELVFPAGPGVISLTHFHMAFVIIGIIALIAVADTVGLAPEAGDTLRKVRPAADPATPASHA